MLIINHKVYSHHKHRRGRVQKIDGSSLPQVSIFLKGEVCYLGFLTCVMPRNEMGEAFSQKVKVWQDNCARSDERDGLLSFLDRELKSGVGSVSAVAAIAENISVPLM